MTFKCSDKCTGILAAEARLLREKTCYQTAQRNNDVRNAERAKRKMKSTEDYIKLVEEWPTAGQIAIENALRIAHIKQDMKKTAIKIQIQRAIETGISPIDGEPIGKTGITRNMIKYLIAKHDNKQFIQEKRFMLTQNAQRSIQYAITKCRENESVVKFLESLLVTKC